MKSKLEIKTSFVSPVTLQLFVENNYLPIFALRSIANSTLIGDWSKSTLHFKTLSPSADLFRKKRDGKINLEEYKKMYTIELSSINLKEIIFKLENLVELSDARGVVILGFGSDNANCHRTVLAEVLNESGLLEKKITEIIF